MSMACMPFKATSVRTIRVRASAEESRALEVGVVVCDGATRNCSFNTIALNALCFPDDPSAVKDPGRFLWDRLQSLSMRCMTSAGTIVSGRRTYSWCRSKLHSSTSGTSQILILLRGDVAPLVLVQASERFRLSRRELEIVRLLLGGKTSKEIAADIGISPNTVKTLLRILMAKMGVSTRSGILGKVLMTAAPVALASFLL